MGVLWPVYVVWYEVVIKYGEGGGYKTGGGGGVSQVLPRLQKKVCVWGGGGGRGG